MTSFENRITSSGTELAWLAESHNLSASGTGIRRSHCTATPREIVVMFPELSRQQQQQQQYLSEITVNKSKYTEPNNIRTSIYIETRINTNIFKVPNRP